MPHLAGVNPPQPLVLGESSKVDDWMVWKQQWTNYCTLSFLDRMDAKFQFAMMENCLGPAALKSYNSLVFGRGEIKNIASIMNKMELLIVGELNETYERYVFNCRNQLAKETIDTYVMELKNLAKNCNFCECMRDSLIRDRIVMGIIDKDARKKLLQVKKLTLDQSVDICRALEATTSRLKAISGNHQASAEEVHKVHGKRQKTPFHSSHKPSPSSASKSRQAKECKFCGKTHEMLKSKCPAYGKKCSKCGQLNHFAVKCPGSKGKKGVHALGEEYDSDFENISIVNAVAGNHDKQIYAELAIEGKPVRVQVDCGASVNVLPKKFTSSNSNITPTSTVLQMWNGSRVKPLGEAKLVVENPATTAKYRCKFIIVDDEAGFVPLLGSKASQGMNIISVNSDNFKRVAAVRDCPLAAYPDVFSDTLGRLPGCVHFEVDESAAPSIAPSRRVPLALREPLKKELKKLVELGVITPVDEPTDWLNNIVVGVKKTGDLRVCIDPQLLNKALKRERYQLPVLEDFLPDLHRARIYTVIDLKWGYWHVVLDEASSLLTTFNTPYGRYRWLRLPFGCNVSSEMFQKKLHLAIGDLEGILCVADDLMLYGVGDTDEEALVDHDRKLDALLKRCSSVGIRLNKAKVKLRQTSAPFLGHLVTNKGLLPDPEKVKAVKEMPAPTDVEGVQRLNGFVNYLAKFLPQLSDVMQPIRQLTRQDVPWNWAPVQEKAFTKVKELVMQAPILRFYDPEKPLTIQCDASEKGLGAALLQEGQPLCFASRALTDTETRYAQIEKEMLAIVFAVEKFHQYTFARPVNVQSDHKPLESILKKPLFAAPRRLQGMMMRLQRYNVEVTYTKGSLLYLADTLSRAFLPSKPGPSPQDDLEYVSMVQYLPISDRRLQQIRDHTSKDESLQLLKSVISSGWPEEKSSLPSQVAPYFSFRDELTAQDGLIFRGERVVIPVDLRQTLKDRVHSSHLGVEGCLRRARECLFWPNMNAEMKDFISRCAICRSHETSQQKETLMSHDIPDRPWAKVGTDLFSIDGIDYLVTVDYYSNFWEVDKLEDTESATVIRKLKAHFARYGIPDQVISDNGPQYTSNVFADFARAWDFEHLTSSPGHSQSNGKAESAVKTAKKLIKRAKESRSDAYLAILDHRNTPTQGLGSSPAQNLMNRRTKTLLPTTARLLTPKLTFCHPELKSNQARQARYHDKGAKELTPLEEGDVVRMKPIQRNQVWKQGVVAKRYDERSYEVETADGSYRRNRVHLKTSREPPPVPVPAPVSTPPKPATGKSTPCTPVPPALPATPATSHVSAPESPRPPPRPAVANSSMPRTPKIVKPVETPPGRTMTRSGRVVVKPSRFRDN